METTDRATETFLDTIELTYPFDSDNTVNVWGDYDTLKYVSSRHRVGDRVTDVKTEWTLTGQLRDDAGKVRVIVKNLTHEEVASALTTVFFRTANRIDSSVALE